jgi:hypothetical protein
LKFFALPLLLLLASGCSDGVGHESEIYTLYSTNHPNDSGRSGIATFDLAKVPFNSQMCQETAEMYKLDFEKRKKENGWGDGVKARYWCEKGRFK